VGKHVVKQGECLAAIAARHGFTEWRSIYDHPDNAALRQKRPNPHLLFPGDEVFIPEKTRRTVSAQTGQTVSVTIDVLRRELRLRLHAAPGLPLRNQPWTLRGGGLLLAGETDGDGLLTARLPTHVSRLTVFADGHDWEVLLGHLNPLEDVPDGGVSGAQGRLANLGYQPGPADGLLGPRTAAALSAFQREHGLPPTGALDRDTIRKLAEAHGS
jgi:N-acetylmuramoyl-L-alanine amidase